MRQLTLLTEPNRNVPSDFLNTFNTYTTVYQSKMNSCWQHSLNWPVVSGIDKYLYLRQQTKEAFCSLYRYYIFHHSIINPLIYFSLSGLKIKL